MIEIYGSKTCRDTGGGRRPSGEGPLALADATRLRCRSSVTPGHQLVEPCDLLLGDAAEDVGESGLWIDAIQLRGLEQRIGDRG